MYYDRILYKQICIQYSLAPGRFEMYKLSKKIPSTFLQIYFTWYMYIYWVEDIKSVTSVYIYNCPVLE